MLDLESPHGRYWRIVGERGPTRVAKEDGVHDREAEGGESQPADTDLTDHHAQRFRQRLSLWERRCEELASKF